MNFEQYKTRCFRSQCASFLSCKSQKLNIFVSICLGRICLNHSLQKQRFDIKNNLKIPLVVQWDRETTKKPDYKMIDNKASQRHCQMFCYLLDKAQNLGLTLWTPNNWQDRRPAILLANFFNIFSSYGCHQDSSIQVNKQKAKVKKRKIKARVKRGL